MYTEVGSTCVVVCIVVNIYVIKLFFVLQISMQFLHFITNEINLELIIAGLITDQMALSHY